jgi:hypothetical protein
MNKQYRLAWRATVGFVCEYEVIALLSKGRIPTVSALAKRYPFVAPSLLVALFTHFYLEEQWDSMISKRRSVRLGIG